MDRKQKIKILELLQSGDISTDFLKTMDRQIFNFWQNEDETGYNTTDLIMNIHRRNLGEEIENEFFTNNEYKEFTQKIHYQNMMREKIGLDPHLIIQIVRDKKSPLHFGKFTT